MTMQSSNLLPALQELPGGDESGQNRSFRDNITGIVNMDRAMYAAEFAAGVSFGLWYIFEDRTLMGITVPGTGINVDDDWREKLTYAHELAFPSEAQSVWEHFQDASKIPETFHNTFMNDFKGTLAELLHKEALEAQGWTQVTLAPNPNQEIVDLVGVNPEGFIAGVQSKFGTSYENSDVEKWMSTEPEEVRRAIVEVLSHDDVNIQGIMPDEPELYLALASDTVTRASDAGTDLAGRLVAEIGFNYEVVGGITDGLETLAGNYGLDIPDDIAGMVPYIGEIAIGLRLVFGAIKTENQFKALDRTAKNKMHVVQALTAMARIGITSVTTAAGGALGTGIGTILPAAGNIIGGGIGLLTGAGTGMYLNRHLQPHMLNLALDITGLTNDDLFYYKNKVRIDDVALGFHERATALAAPL